MRQAQWRTFGTRPVKNASFELIHQINVFLIDITSTSRTCNLFLKVSCLNNKSLSLISRIYFERVLNDFCLQIRSYAKYFSSFVQDIVVED